MLKINTGNDYFAFGASMPGRNFSPNSYTHGFGGQLKDDEVTGRTGEIYSAEFWEYNSWTAKRWNPDPVFNPSVSAYATFDNSPILLNCCFWQQIRFLLTNNILFLKKS